MNCQNCGAPMTPKALDTCFACDYCHTFQFNLPLEDSVDRIVPLTRHAEMDCPICQQQLAVGSIEEVEVRYCEKCRGLLFSSDDLAYVVKRRRANYQGADSTPTPLDQTALRRQVGCPTCRQPMEVHPYYGPGNVVIDSCHRCRQIWVDHGELASIEQAPGRR